MVKDVISPRIISKMIRIEALEGSVLNMGAPITNIARIKNRMKDLERKKFQEVAKLQLRLQIKTGFRQLVNFECSKRQLWVYH